MTTTFLGCSSTSSISAFTDNCFGRTITKDCKKLFSLSGWMPAFLNSSAINCAALSMPVVPVILPCISSSSSIKLFAFIISVIT
jgi:hypothetical protein